MFDLTLMQKYMLDTPLVNEFIESCVARCDYCGMPIFKCTCEEEDEEEYTDEQLGIYETEEQTDAYGRNFSDADPGL
jgi:hypothetical protein